MMEPTPEQWAAFYALCSIINLGILATLGWLVFCDWIEARFIEPYKERLRKEVAELMPIEEVNVFEDKDRPGVWWIEAFDEEGACFVKQITGARDDAEAYALKRYGRATVMLATRSRLPTPVRIP